MRGPVKLRKVESLDQVKLLCPDSLPLRVFVVILHNTTHSSLDWKPRSFRNCCYLTHVFQKFEIQISSSHTIAFGFACIADIDRHVVDSRFGSISHDCNRVDLSNTNLSHSFGL